jgi:F-type H+-transporting ATPase subunit b
MLDEARRDAEHTKQQIVAEAKAAAQAEHERGMRDIRTATDAAVKELSERSTDLAIALAGKVISTKLTPEERSRLVQDSLNKFAAATPSKN